MAFYKGNRYIKQIQIKNVGKTQESDAPSATIYDFTPIFLKSSFFNCVTSLFRCISSHFLLHWVVLIQNIAVKLNKTVSSWECSFLISERSLSNFRLLLRTSNPDSFPPLRSQDAVVVNVLHNGISNGIACYIDYGFERKLSRNQSKFSSK